MGKQSLTPTEQYRTELTRLNERIEALGNPRKVTAHGIEYMMNSELRPRPELKQEVEWWEQEREDRERLAALPSEQLAKICDLLAGRAQVIRALKLADAQESRPKWEDEHGPIAWHAPELGQAFARLCDAIDFHGPGASEYEFAGSQLYDSLRSGWAFDQLNAFGATAIYHGLVAQFDETQLIGLRVELADAQASTWIAEVRNGYDLLCDLVKDAAVEVVASRCPGNAQAAIGTLIG